MRTIFLLTLMYFLFSSVASADFSAPQSCIDLASAEMQKYGLGSFDRPAADVNKSMRSNSVEFAGTGKQNSKNIFYIFANVTDDHGDEHPYTIIISQLKPDNRKTQNLKLYLNTDCSKITQIGLSSTEDISSLDVLISATGCQLINDKKISRLHYLDAHQFERAPKEAEKSCKEYEKLLEKKDTANNSVEKVDSSTSSAEQAK